LKHLLANQIRVFLSIVDAGSITAAAEHLSMGKSGVSDALKNLETSLGVQLLVRTTRRQNLTSVGEQFYLRCRELNNLSKAALEEISEHLAEPKGSLRITAPHATIEHCLAPAIAALIARYPGVEPELIIDDRRLDLIGQKIDLALTVGELPDSEYKAQRVGTLNDVLCATPHFIEKRKVNSKNNLDDLNGLPYVGNCWEDSESTYTLSPYGSKNTTTLRFTRVSTASSVNAVLALIEQGVGIGVLPHFFINEKLRSGELVELLPKHVPRSTSIYAIHPFGHFPPLSVRAMIGEIKKRLNEVS
jgi:DNA-binding transcriptional LysR family regulator